MAIRTSRRTFLAGSTIFLSAATIGCETSLVGPPSDPLAEGFRTPPNAARPRVWWHWMNGNVTAQGIHADFAWMQRVGIGGVHNFDASLGTPPLVERRIAYLTPEWRELFRGAVGRADAAGMEFTIAGSPGWSQTGGPWVEPDQAMKKLVWSETVIEGGQPFRGALAAPPGVAGPFANLPVAGGFGPLTIPDSDVPDHFYRDQVVIAYRAPDVDRPLNASASITTSGGAIDAAKLSDGDYADAVDVPFGDDDATTTWIQFAFDEPQTARALTLMMRGQTGFGGADPVVGRIEASDDGVDFRTIANLPGTTLIPRTIAFAATTARVFRASFDIDRTPPPAPFGPPLPPPVAHPISQLVLNGGARVNHFEDKAGFEHEADLHQFPPLAVDAAARITQDDVIDLTDRMDADGVLDWAPPSGRWVVLRMGYSLTGSQNGPASAEGTGLEVDKLNREHVRAYLDAYLGEYEATLGNALIGERGLQFLLTDSYEAGAANWTDDIAERFRARRGYDLRPWLPVLAGRVIDSAEASERFLWDHRQTLGELIADEHYAEISDALHERGMGRYGESHEAGRAFIGDGMAVKKSADIPMGATWMPQADFGPLEHMRHADIRETASVAHIYGQNLAAAESLTALGSAANTYAFAPERLKPVADRMMANGLNRFVIHTSVHQPLDDPGPGIGLGPFGQWFTRKETWAEFAGAWLDYLSRSCWLLQQGRFVADIAYFYGEDDNITSLFSEAPPPIPDGYAFDYVNADALINTFTSRDSRLVASSGMTYRALVLDPATRRMTLPALRKIADLAAAGVPIIGLKPETTPSLADDAVEFARLADEIWGGTAITAPLPEAMAAIAPPDFVHTKPEPDTELVFVHRALDEGDLYFVSSLNDRAQDVDASFRVTGKAPEIWRADVESVEPASYRVENGRTIVPLSLHPHDAVFVVFRADAADRSRDVPAPTDMTLATLEDGWRVEFPIADGVRTIDLAALASWTEHEDPDIRYFSGTARYVRMVELDDRPDGRIILDLGHVKNVAEVRVNGRVAGIAWKEPFEADVTALVQLGANTLEVRVANLWPNRLIGDKQPGAESHASAVFDPYTADSPLLDSGLLGPVRILARGSSNQS